MDREKTYMNVIHSSIEGYTVIGPFKKHGSIDRTEYDYGKPSKPGSERQTHPMCSYTESKNGWFHRGRENSAFWRGGRVGAGRMEADWVTATTYHRAVPQEGQV